MYKIIALLISASLSVFCFGQKHMEKGFILNNNGEQIEGLIEIQSNIQNSKSCLFQNVKEGTLESLTPDDIKSYKTASKYYVSHEVEINSVKQKVFLEYLVDGIVDLYYLREPVNEYYFVEKDGKLYPLDNNEKKLEIEETGIGHNLITYSKSSNQYKGALNYLFSDAQGFNQKINSTPFNYRSLINVTKEYHNAVCSEYECLDYTRSTTQGIFLELSAGLWFSKMHLTGSKTGVHNVKPGITAQLRFVPLKSNTGWNFLIGLSYSENDFHGLFDTGDYSHYARKDSFDISLKYSILRLPVTVQYEFGSGKLQPLISIGYNACYYLGAEYSVARRIHNINAPLASDLRRFQHGFTGGLGLKYNLGKSDYLFIKGIYEYRVPSAILGDVMDYVRNNTITINFGYAFNI